MTDDEKAMNAVIESMGQAARAAKAKKYAPKAAPQAEAAPEVPTEDDGALPKLGELEAMLNGG